MARQAREMSKSGNYYIVLKGDGLFNSNDDRNRFMEISKEKLGEIYGAEMGNYEIRMAVKETGAGISMNMKSVTTMYARYFNRASGREGKLFEGRFKSMPLESAEEIDECLRNLKAGAAEPRRAKKTAVKPFNAEKAAAIAAEPVKRAERKLPSWLL